MTWCGYKLNTDEFPTINRDNPLELTSEEKEVIEGLVSGVMASEKMNKHLKFLFANGRLYIIYNSNLLYHGCIPVDEKGEFLEVEIGGKTYSGKAYMDYCERRLRGAYNKNKGDSPDFAWYLWCAPDSPLFGKKKMATFERMYIDDKEAHKEGKQPYFLLQDSQELCIKIMEEFGVDSNKGHIINGHIPVKLMDGENPIKADGKLILIDGGLSKAYRKQTGIAGFTLTFNSFGLTLTAHSSFENVGYMVENNMEMLSQKNVVEKVEKRILVKDTDKGRKLSDDIEDLETLMFLYQSGTISETNMAKTKKK